MFCPNCGARNNDPNFKCRNCGTVISHPRVRAAHTAGQSNALAKVAIGIGIFFVFIVISGIIAAIAIPAFLGYKARAANNLALSSVKDGCAAAMTVLQENPRQIITINDLLARGFTPQPGVEMTISDGSLNSFSIAAKHVGGNRIFLANRDCRVQEAPVQH